jgi:TonB family protein
MATSRRLVLPLIIAASFTQPVLAQQPGPKDPIGSARDLYASARYDEALAVLNDMRPAEASAPGADRRAIEQYRSLCLLALGRGSEAESAIAAVVTADPSYQPGDADASPRVRAAFSDVRKRLLPDIVTARYGDAKAAFDRKDYPTATRQFREVMGLLSDSDMGGRLPDLKTLAAGFLDLSTAATPPPAPPPAPVPAPVVPPPAPKRDPFHIYGVQDANVTPPVVIHQDMPRLAPSMTRQAKERGIVEVVVDEQGRVMSVTMRASVHPMYDSQVLVAARDWKYEPATLDGKPVRYRKMIQINVAR